MYWHGLFLASSMKAAIHLGPDFLTNSEIHKNTKFENIWSVVNISRKLIKEHSEEILNVESLEYSSPSRTRSILANDQPVKSAKAKVCVHADSVLCVGQVKDISGATERWKGQVEDLKRYSSYQDAVGLDGEPIESEWKIFSRFSSLSLLRDVNVQRHWVEKRMMKNVFRTPKKSGITPWNSCTDIGRFWVQDRKKSGMAIPTIKRTVELHRQQSGTAIQRHWSSCLQEHQCFESWDIEPKERQMYHSSQLRYTNTELLFQPVHFVNQLSVYGAVANWCYQFAFTDEEKGRVAIPVDNKILTMVEPEEVELLVYLPTQAPGNRMQGGALSFQKMEKKKQLTLFWEKAFFQHLVFAGNYYKNRPNADDGWREITPLCREYSSSRSENNSTVGNSRRYHHWTSFGCSRSKKF